MDIKHIFELFYFISSTYKINSHNIGVKIFSKLSYVNELIFSNQSPFAISKMNNLI